MTPSLHSLDLAADSTDRAVADPALALAPWRPAAEQTHALVAELAADERGRAEAAQRPAKAAGTPTWAKAADSKAADAPAAAPDTAKAAGTPTCWAKAADTYDTTKAAEAGYAWTYVVGAAGAEQRQTSHKSERQSGAMSRLRRLSDKHD